VLARALRLLEAARIDAYMAKIGFLFLNEGVWDGTRILSAAWVEEATEARVSPTNDPTVSYGLGWWVLGGDYEGIYEARGRSGQAITVWPEQDLVVAWTGCGSEDRERVSLFLVDAVRSDEPLPENPAAVSSLEHAIAAASEASSPIDVRPLPPLAKTISGIRYSLATNLLAVTAFELRFANETEVSFFIGDEEFRLPVGLDGVQRFGDGLTEGIDVGMTGRWYGDAFEMTFDERGGVNHFRFRVTFENEGAGVTIDITDASGYYSDQHVVGERVE
jgi:hypothetical protein